MEDVQADINQALVLDGNAAAGALAEVFALEMTERPVQCAGCGREGELGSLQAYLHTAGVVLRCPGCGNIILRIVKTPAAILVDLRGAAYLSLEQNPL